MIHLDRAIIRGSTFFIPLHLTMKKQRFLTHKQAVRQVLDELGGRARLQDIYPRVIPLIHYKKGSNIQATLRRLLQTTPDSFRHSVGMRGWYELISYQEELAMRDRKIAELTKSQITKEKIISVFAGFDMPQEKMFAKQMMQMLFRGNPAWESAYKVLKRGGYFKDMNFMSKVEINNHFHSEINAVNIKG